MEKYESLLKRCVLYYGFVYVSAVSGVGRKI